jgi:hypothetical protein
MVQNYFCPFGSHLLQFCDFLNQSKIIRSDFWLNQNGLENQKLGVNRFHSTTVHSCSSTPFSLHFPHSLFDLACPLAAHQSCVVHHAFSRHSPLSMVFCNVCSTLVCHVVTPRLFAPAHPSSSCLRVWRWRVSVRSTLSVAVLFVSSLHLLPPLFPR